MRGRGGIRLAGIAPPPESKSPRASAAGAILSINFVGFIRSNPTCQARFEKYFRGANLAGKCYVLPMAGIGTIHLAVYGIVLLIIAGLPVAAIVVIVRARRNRRP
jgi:hypothetical protein